MNYTKNKLPVLWKAILDFFICTECLTRLMVVLKIVENAVDVEPKERHFQVCCKRMHCKECPKFLFMPSNRLKKLYLVSSLDL